MNNPHDLVAGTGFFTGLHSGMGIAAKGMVIAFVVFTALNVDVANDIYSSIRGWIESAQRSSSLRHGAGRELLPAPRTSISTRWRPPSRFR